MVRFALSIRAATGVTLLLVAVLPPRVAAHATAAAPAAVPSPADTLSFEVPGAGPLPSGWRANQEETTSLDSVTAHGGRYAARIRRDASSKGAFSALIRSVPLSAAGDSLELQGWLRTGGVTGYAGLWLREDAADGALVRFDNMDGRGPGGTTPWTGYRIALPLDRRARSVSFGALLQGRGAVHADDLQLRVDGVPIADAPPAARRATGIDTDHEFDAGSRVTASSLSRTQAERVALLVRVWGFVKYHDRRVAAGALHWDYELFRALPAVLEARTGPEARRAIVRWLDRLGAPAPCDPCASPPDSSVLPAPIEWIHDRRALGRDLCERLERIHARRDPDLDPYYASFGGGRIPDFSGEEPFASPALPDPGYRILSLARYWNIVEYWFAYRDLIPGDWDRVLEDFLPRVVAASDAHAYRRVMTELFTRVGDGHATVWGDWDVRPPEGPCQIAATLRPVEGRYVVHAYRDSTLGPASGLKPGDVLLAIDGAPVDSLVAANASYYSASNDPARRREIAFTLTRGPCGPCRLRVERDGHAVEVASRRDSTEALDLLAGRTHDLPGEAFRLLSPEAAYLKLSAVKQSDCASYIGRAAGTRCFVVDIRNYPSDFVPFALAGHFVTEPTPFVRFTGADPANPGAFAWTSPLVVPPLEPHYPGRLVILVDEASISQSEYTAMALRAAPQAIVVGSATAGADGNAVRIALPGGLLTAVSTLGVFFPDGSPTQQRGLIPDVEAHATVDGIRRGRDVVLEAALRKVLGHEVAVPSRP